MKKKKIKSQIEIIAELKKDGITVTENQLEYYRLLGLLPPATRVRENRGMYAYFDVDVVRTIKKIQKLKNDGHKLPEIKEVLKKHVLDVYFSILKKFGFNDWLSLSRLHLMGIQFDEDSFLNISKKLGFADPQKWSTHLRKRHESELLRKIKFWWDDHEVETAALFDINDHVEDAENKLYEFTIFISHIRRDIAGEERAFMRILAEISARRKYLDDLRVRINKEMGADTLNDITKEDMIDANRQSEKRGNF